jgi:trk system potassium uptake protein TrkH
MFIGASPGSTGGGIKTTTFFTMVSSVFSFLRSHDDVNAFERKIEDSAVRRAFNSTALYLSIAALGVFIISLQGVSVEDAMFEAVSAIGTVGLSKNLTPNLTVLSKATIITLMYFGRLGSLSVLMAVTDRRIKTYIGHVEEKIIIG